MLALVLPSNSKTWLERVSKDKLSCLLELGISDEGKKFYDIATSLFCSVVSDEEQKVFQRGQQDQPKVVEFLNIMADTVVNIGGS